MGAEPHPPGRLLRAPAVTTTPVATPYRTTCCCSSRSATQQRLGTASGSCPSTRQQEFPRCGWSTWRRERWRSAAGPKAAPTRRPPGRGQREPGAGGLPGRHPRSTRPDVLVVRLPGQRSCQMSWMDKRRPLAAASCSRSPRSPVTTATPRSLASWTTVASIASPPPLRPKSWPAPIARARSTLYVSYPEGHLTADQPRRIDEIRQADGVTRRRSGPSGPGRLSGQAARLVICPCRHLRRRPGGAGTKPRRVRAGPLGRELE